MSSQEGYYPPPSHNLPTIWRNRSSLVMTKQASLPDRCIKCNAPTQNKLKRNLRWHHQALYALILLGFIPYAIFALVLGKTATVNVGLCEAHVSARKRAMLIALLLVLFSFVLFVVGIANESPALVLVGMLLFLGGVIFGVLKTKVVVPQKIDNEYVWLNGINSDYLNQFPEWGGAR
jgi:hypothetical protein